ncbi:MAG: (d)CMP kinase [Bacteroidota bacterium]
MIVAIDGPAGSGKSTTARLVAKRFGWLYLDTGAMYRTVALAFLRAGAAFTNEAAESVAASLALRVEPQSDGMRVILDGEDVTGQIRTPEVGEAASRVSSLPAVRAALLDVQRQTARRLVSEGGGVVLDGRDIGTVVFPDADLKVFMKADLDERAERRHAELVRKCEAKGTPPPDLEAVRAEIAERDRRDTQRAHAPLRQADDAVALDTTTHSIEEQVEHVLHLIAERGGPSVI